MSNHTTSCIQQTPEGILLSLRVQPRSHRTEILGPMGEALKIRISAPPVDDAANACLLHFLSKELKIPKSRIQLTKGRNARNKRVLLIGLNISDLPDVFVKKCTSGASFP
ncbi:MAG: DUF167 domain-containing protein [Verrucomicrobiota bacterium]|nr:DUF167 domain-containing protein [Verrucomicrobiota bacterium]MDG1889819.1 DUF167 domain-containing protein [Verrucomicrobiota bacterium]